MKKTKAKERAIVLIDAGYLSKVVKNLGGGNYFRYNLQTFCINVCKRLNYWCEEIVYYTAPPFQNDKPTPNQIRLKKGYDSTIEKMKKSGLPPIKIREGRLQKIGDTYKQKGVDTRIAFDLLRYSQIRNHEAIILVSADTDFVPIIKELEGMYKTKLFLSYFTDLTRKSSFSLSNELWEVFGDNKLKIKKDDFFLPQQNEEEY